MADYLTDDQFLGGSAAGAAPAQPVQPKYLTDEQFLGGAPAGKYLTDEQFLGGQQAAPRTPSRGFFGELTNNFMSTLIKTNPKLAGTALEGFAELLEPSPAAKAGAEVGAMVPPKPGEAPQQPPAGTNRLRQLATALQEYGKKGEEERRPAVPSLWDIRTNEGLGTATQDALDFLGQALGQGGGSSAPGIATGMAAAAITKNPIAGFFAGAFGPSYIQNFGDTYDAMLQDKDIQAALKSGKQTKQNLAKIAAEWTIPMAGLDSLEATAVFGGLAKDLKGNLMKRMLKRGLIGLGMEAPTEGSQQALQEAALEVGGGKKSFYDQVKSVIDATVQGGIGGFGISTLRPGPRAVDQVTEPVPAEDVLPPEEPPPAAPPAPVTTVPPPAPAPAPEQTTANLTAAWQKLLASGRSLDELRQMRPEETLAAAAALPAPAPAPAQTRPDSPRLTPADRTSPIPNDIIDDGKRLVEAATGQPATVTTAQEVGGHVQVSTTDVADIVAKDRAETTALIDRITAGVAPAEIAPQTGQPAPPAIAEAVPGIGTPAETIATPPPSPAEAPLSPAVAEHHAAATAPSPDQLPAIEGTPMAKKGDTLADQIKKLKARSAARDAEVAQLIESGPSIKMESNRDPSHKAMVGPDMSEPGKFRVTYIDQHGPSGHTVHNTMEDAVSQVVGLYHPIGQIAKQVVKQDTAFTPGGRDIPVAYAVVEAGDLTTSQRDEGGANPDYPQELQPRDRSRGTSEIQINEIAQKLNPALLDNNASATDGAPIVSPEGVVESGNGRILGIRRAYGQGLQTAEGYRQYLIDQGYLDSFTAKKMKNPVLVRIRQATMEMGERTAFAREANQRTTMEMSEPEQAMADAAAMPDATVALFRGGDVTEAGNRDFVRSFAQSVVSPNEQGAMVTSDAELSQKAARRMRSALLARAYGDANLVSKLVESLDNNIKAIGGALMDVAGLWSQMRAEAKAGSISPEADITDAVLEAVRLVERARSEGRPLAEYVGQHDVFSGKTISPLGEGVLRLMFRNTASWTMPAGREKLAEALTFYATEARKTSAGVDLLGEAAPAPEKILETAKARQYGPEETQQTLPGGGRTAGPDTGTSGQKRAVEAKQGPQAEGRPSPAAKAPAKKKSKLAKKVAAKRAAARAKAKAAEEAKAKAAEPQAEGEVAQPKFSRPGPDEPPTQRLSTKEKLLKKRIVRKIKTDPEAVAAMAAMSAVPETSKEEGFNTDPWWDARRFNVGGKKVALEEYLKHLYAVAKGLSTKEINEGIDQHNRKLKETEAKTGMKGTPIDHVEGYTVANNKEVFIVQGPPAAGKSTIANIIARLYKAAISDIDEAKKGIPGYVAPDASGKMTPGIGASAVHAESGKIGTRISDQLISEGANLVIPTVGDTHNKVEFLREMLQKAGYKVHLVLMDIREDTAANRMWGRFKGTGRLIDPDYFMDVVFKPPHVFEYAKSKGKFDGYIKIKTDNFLAARVTEIAGKVQGLAVGDRFVAGGKIRPGGFSRLGGAGQRTKIRPGAGRAARQQEVEIGRAVSFLAPGGQSETVSAAGTEINYSTTPEFAAKAGAFLKTLRKTLDHYGLTGVDLKVWENILVNQGKADQFSANGVYLHDAINLALQIGSKSVDVEEALHHEAMHAILELAATDNEKAILRRKSRKEWITDAIKKGYSESQWVEEGITHAYTRWLKGERMDGMINRSFKKFKTFLKGLYQALTGHDIRTAEDVFRQVQSGKIGQRTRAGAAYEVTSQASASTLYSKGERPTETVDMFEGPREQYVIPGAEKLTDAQLAQRRADQKLQAKKPQKSVEALPLFGDQKDQLALFSKPPSGPNDPRFSLIAPPATSQQAQQTMQGFINRGQPIDRALRFPFELIGGLDAQNRWSWGKRLTDRMGPAGLQGFGIGGVIGAGIGTFVGGPVGGFVGGFAGGTVGRYILGSSPHPGGGRFGWFHGMAEHAKRGLIDGYGLDPAYLETYRKSELGKAAILREAQGIMKVLSNAGVGTNEAKVLHSILNGDPVNDAAMQRLAQPIRQAIDDMGAEAVSLGLLSAESFQRNRGAYLHRVYLKNEVDQASLAGWVSAKMTSRRKKIIGDQMKGRGMFMDIAGDRLMQDVASFQSGKRGAAAIGEKFHVIDEVSSTANLQSGAAPSQKTLRRVYLPANEAVPAKYQGASWVDRGTWEVRKAGNKPTLWRDFTKAERGKMGELIDARYTVAKTFMLMANDLSTGRFFKDVAQKQEWTKSTPPPDGTWKDHSEYSQHWNDPEIQWVKVPDTNIDKTGGKKKWGALSGKFVRAEIWRDLNEVNIANTPGTWRILLTQWKKNKTARNPVVHMNNIMSNVMFMDLADVRTQDLVAGIKAFFKGDANYQEALDNGAFGGDMVSQEIRDEVLKPILEEITKQQTGAGNPFLAKAGMAGVIADKLWTWAKKADNGMLRAYQAEDQLFRMATYMRRRSQGESAKVAAQEARDQFLNYDIRAPWVRAMRNSMLPFISYTYRAVPKLAENIAHRPWKLAKYMAIAYAVNALAYMLDDWDDDDKDKDGEERERAALRDEEQGDTWLKTPRMIRMPWRDQHGLPVFLDIRRWIPAGDIFDTGQGSTALPMPAPLQFGGPLQMAYEFALNKQAFTGEDITNDLTMDNPEKLSAVADWAWKSWAPASFWTPRSWYWTKIGNALYGATDTAGHPYSVPQALLSSIGVKVKPVDVEDGIKWHFFDFKQMQTALKKDLRSLARQRDRGLISERAFNSGSAKIMRKFENLGQNIEEFQQRIE